MDEAQPDGAQLLAFYRAPGTWRDRMIRWGTRGPYSHCELLWLPPEGVVRKSLTISASDRDGGVRVKVIDLDPAKWDLIEVPWAPQDAWERAESHLGLRYDLKGVLLSHTVALARQDPRRWFCSELCAHALGLAEPHRYSPTSLALACRAVTRGWEGGWEAAQAAA